MKKQHHTLVFVFAKNRGEASTRFGGFARRLQKNGHFANCTIRSVALEDIVFDIASGNDSYALIDGTDPFIDADMVYFKSWESEQELAATLAALLKARGVPYIDASVGGVGVSKLPMMMKLWALDIPVPHTLYARKLSAEQVQSTIGFPCIVKAIHGQKGRDNYLVNDSNAFCELIADITLKDFIAQEFVPNNGDYRLWVYGGKVRGGLFRKAGHGHVHNTSQGAEAQLLAPEDISPELSSVGVSSAKAMQLSISGVDVMQSTATGKYYVLEANQGSQIVTGAHVDEKMRAFADGIDDLLEKRHMRKKTPQYKLDIIGRHVAVDFPDWGINAMIGKVDTGAYQAALHAENISEKDGKLSFDVAEFEDRDGNKIPKARQTVDEYSFAEVRSTSGVLEKRYLVPVRFVVKGRVFRSKVTLTNRGTMKYPLLIGRRTLRGRFLVNSELSRKTSL